ncbi:MAG: AAA family ATPase [Salinispira sp.]
MEKNENPSIKLRAISIKNYKGIDSLSIDFPAPTLSGDPDILVMGSENGLGKTSVIECCALLLMCLSTKKNELKIKEIDSVISAIDISDLLIRVGAEAAEITGNIIINDGAVEMTIRITRNGTVKISRNIPHLELFVNDIDVNELIAAICGVSPNPVIENIFLLFHSYRKVQEGSPPLAMITIDSRRAMLPYQRMGMPLSEFKNTVMRLLVTRADLFEFASDKEPEEIINTLNDLVKYYAGGTIQKLRPSANAIDLRITPVDGGESVPLDGLSSGQKEIISTLFLICYHSKNKPLIVFIDEPELHLNAQWHRSVVNNLLKRAPQNQYIIATHSEDVMDSVYKDRRILLRQEGKPH